MCNYPYLKSYKFRKQFKTRRSNQCNYVELRLIEPTLISVAVGFKKQMLRHMFHVPSFTNLFYSVNLLASSSFFVFVTRDKLLHGSRKALAVKCHTKDCSSFYLILN